MTDLSLHGSLAVDLTPMMPGGANGGIKPLTLRLLKGLAESGWDIACLCRPECESEMRAKLGSAVLLAPVQLGQDPGLCFDRLVREGRTFDLAFFPMQNVSFVRPGLAIVSSIMDLQFLDRPENFSPAECAERDRSFQNCLAHSDRIIAISRYTRDRILAHSSLDAGQIDIIHIAPLDIGEPATGSRDALARYDLAADRYLLYPANFWPHKNHLRLIGAYRALASEWRDAFKLVLPGNPGGDLARRMADAAGNDANIVLPGFVPDEDIRALLEGCRALVFPSTYEGFGMPLIEAMAVGRPVAAAWSTCIPEVADRAALLFDETCPVAMARAMTSITLDESLRAQLVRRGHDRARILCSPETMTERYQRAFEAALTARRRAPVQRPAGLYADGWTGPEVTFSVPGRAGPSLLEVRLRVPLMLPTDLVTVDVVVGQARARDVVLWRGRDYTFRCDCPAEGGEVTIAVHQAFEPSASFATTDRRVLGVQIKAAELIAGGHRIDLIHGGPGRTDAKRKRPAALVVSVVGGDGTARMLASLVPADEADPAGLRLHTAAGAVELGIVRPGPADIVADLCDPADSRGLTIRAEDPELSVLALSAQALGSPTPIPQVTRRAAGRFSVIVPSFNQGRFIRRTLESVMRQESVQEIRVHDGGSTDDTLSVLAEFGTAITFDSRPDKGQADAVNQGLAAAQGEFIAWINSDDLYEDGALAHVADLFEAHPDVGVIYGEAYHVDETDAVIERYPTEDFDLDRLYGRCFISQPAAFFRRELAERHGGLNESLNYCLDYEFWLRLARSGVRFLRTDRFLASSRIHGETKTASQRPAAYFETARLMQTAFESPHGQWVEHFANAAADHLERSAGSPRSVAVRHAKALFLRALGH